MILTLTRSRFYEDCTISDLAIDGERVCYVLEDTVRYGPKLPGKTAIPYGRYQVIVDESQRFKRMLPRLLDVPGFAGVRIHAGNTDADTQGCLLPGLDWSPAKPDFVGRSRAAFDLIFPRIQAALSAGEECWIDIQRRQETLPSALGKAA